MKLSEMKLRGLLSVSCLLLVGAMPQELPEPSDSENPSELSLGMMRLREQCEAEDFEAARASGLELLAPNQFAGWRRELELEGSKVIAPLLNFSEPLIDLFRLSGYTREERAHVHFALGVVELSAGESQKAKREFGFALERAGQGELRLDAAYDLGTVSFLEGEAWRAQIPELGGQPPQPVPTNPGAAPAPEEEPPDPLEQARGHYLEARDQFVTCLRLDWQAADTRANTELVMRRLRELDEIERQREEQEQEQEQEDQESEDEEEQDDQEGEEGEQEENEESDQEDQQDSQEEQEQEEESEEEQEQEQPEPEEGEEQEEPEPSESEESEEEPEQQAGQEIFLTKEEVQRLLDKVKEHDKEGEELRARMNRQRRRPTARDW
ncbi:MAG: hypothetical protein ACI8X5_003596 [Planctomycetota bacterium]|jgi:hypothetical protein